MAIDPKLNHGEGNPEAAARFNDAEAAFVASPRGQQQIAAGARVTPPQASELQEAERLGRARAKPDEDDPTPQPPQPK